MEEKDKKDDVPKKEENTASEENKKQDISSDNLMSDKNNENKSEDDFSKKETKDVSTHTVKKKKDDIPKHDSSIDKEMGKEKSKKTGKDFLEKVRENPWIASTLVLGIIVIILLFMGFGNSVTGNAITGNAVSPEVAGENLLSFAEQQDMPGDVKLGNISEFNTYFYEASLLIDGQEVPVYITTDGEYIVSNPVPLNFTTPEQPEQVDASAPGQENQQPGSEVSIKSDLPLVELFIMTHCPYGTQAEKGFIPMVRAMGDSIDANIRFVHYFMHGDVEEEETYRQLCIREEQNDKYLDYLECFLEGDGNADSSGYVANGNDPETCMQEAGVDIDAVEQCVDSGKAEEYYAADSELSEQYGVRGSPALVVNGEVVQSGRDAVSYLNTVCGAFNNAPEVCNSQDNLGLSSSAPQPGFGWEGTMTGSTGAQC